MSAHRLALDPTAAVVSMLADGAGGGGVLVSGPWRAGRSATVEAVAREQARSSPVLAVRGGPLLWGLYEAACRLVGRPSLPLPVASAAVRLAESLATDARALGSARPAAHRRLAATLAEVGSVAGRQQTPALLVLDDLDRCPPEDLPLAAWLLQHLRRSGWRSLVTCRDDRLADEPLVDVLGALLDDAVLAPVPVAPLSTEQTERAIAAVTGATPDPTLVSTIGRLAGWRAGAVLDAVAALRRVGAIVVVDGHSFYVPADRAPSLPDGHPVMRHLRGLPVAALAACQLVAAYAHRGDRSCEVDPANRAGVAAGLREAVLVRSGQSVVLAFPLVGHLALELAGPVRRARLVGGGGGERPSVYSAGPVSPPASLASALLRSLATWGAARTPADARAVAAALRHDGIAVRAGLVDQVETARTWPEVAARTALAMGGAAVDVVDLATHLGGVARAQGVDAAVRVVDQRLAGPFGDLVSAALLLGSGQLALAQERLDRDRLDRVGRPSGDDGVSYLRAELDVLVGAASPGPRSDSALTAAAAGAVRALVDRGAGSQPGPPSAASVLADYHGGRWDDALRTARLLESRWAWVPGQASSTLRTVAAEILVHRGRTDHAGAWLRRGHGLALLPHLDAWAHSGLAVAHGDYRDALRMVMVADRAAAKNGLVVGRELVLARWLAIALELGDEAAARQAWSRLDAVREQAGGPAVDFEWRLARCLLDGDEGSGVDALDLAQAADRPADQCRAAMALASLSSSPAARLDQAYRLAIALGSVLWRAKVVAAMRAAGMTVPREERDEAGFTGSERLLADLVAQDCTNRTVALVMRVSDKRVEALLRGLFDRTGCRSRVELAGRYRQGALPGLPPAHWSQPPGPD